MLVKLSSAYAAECCRRLGRKFRGQQKTLPELTKPGVDYSVYRLTKIVDANSELVHPALAPDPSEFPREPEARNPARTMSEASLATSVPARRGWGGRGYLNAYLGFRGL